MAEQTVPVDEEVELDPERHPNSLHPYGCKFPPYSAMRQARKDLQDSPTFFHHAVLHIPSLFILYILILFSPGNTFMIIIKKTVIQRQII